MWTLERVDALNGPCVVDPPRVVHAERREWIVGHVTVGHLLPVHVRLPAERVFHERRDVTRHAQTAVTGSDRVLDRAGVNRELNIGVDRYGQVVEIV